MAVLVFVKAQGQDLSTRGEFPHTDVAIAAAFEKEALLG